MDHVPYPLEAYLNSELSQIAPVDSALATAMREISSGVTDGSIDEAALANLELSTELPRAIRGMINLLRVGLVHGRASGIVESPEEIVEGTFASKQLDAPTRAFANRLVRTQSTVVEEYFGSEDAPSFKLVAQLGLSLETVADLQAYVRSLEDWQIQGFNNVLRGGAINPPQLELVLRAVTARMAELEGKSLGSLFTDIIMHWFSGVSFTAIRSRARQMPREVRRLEDLIAVIYSRVQYLLPWGLYALDRFTEVEAIRRSLQYDNTLQTLAYLGDAGVPNFSALRLTMLDIERVDATRLARRYLQHGGLNTGMDVVQWLRISSKTEVMAAIRGRDNRRIDYDFDAILAGLSSENE